MVWKAALGQDNVIVLSSKHGLPAPGPKATEGRMKTMAMVP
jgi:hypothetical protein